MRKKSVAKAAPDWEKLLVDAVNTPGVLSSAYQRFWNYSVGNQLLALFECLQRGLQLGPIHTFKGWLDLGRHVKKGEKAITLCMPVTVKKKSRPDDLKKNRRREDKQDQKDLPAPTDDKVTVFIYRPRWFVLSQTDGEPYVPTELPEWSEARALPKLGIERIAFTHPDGNCQGFARHRQVAVSPIAEQPSATLFHELAHVVLGHTQEGAMEDHDRTPRSLREVEAECVALICCESLSLAGVAECRGYIQHWLRGGSIPDRSAQRIFRAADAILKGGYPAPTPTPND